MQPTSPVHPDQQIDQIYGPDGLVQEIIHNYPPDGGGVRRWADGQGEHTEPVTGLPIPVGSDRTADEKLAAARTVLSDGAAELVSLPAPATPADLTTTVADILARAAAALNGGA